MLNWISNLTKLYTECRYIWTQMALVSKKDSSKYSLATVCNNFKSHQSCQAKTLVWWHQWSDSVAEAFPRIWERMDRIKSLVQSVNWIYHWRGRPSRRGSCWSWPFLCWDSFHSLSHGTLVWISCWFQENIFNLVWLCDIKGSRPLDSRDDITSNPEPKVEFTFDVLRLEDWKVPVSLLSHQSQDQDAALWSRSGSVGQGCLFMKRLLSSVGPRDVSLKKSDEKCHCKLHSWSKMYSGQCSGHCSVLLKDKKKN